MILNKILEDFERSDQKKGVLFEQKSHKSDKSDRINNKRDLNDLKDLEDFSRSDPKKKENNN